MLQKMLFFMSFATTLQRYNILEAKSSFSAIIFEKKKGKLFSYSVIHLFTFDICILEKLETGILLYIFYIYSNYNY